MVRQQACMGGLCFLNTVSQTDCTQGWPSYEFSKPQCLQREMTRLCTTWVAGASAAEAAMMRSRHSTNWTIKNLILSECRPVEQVTSLTLLTWSQDNSSLTCMLKPCPNVKLSWSSYIGELVFCEGEICSGKLSWGAHI